MGSALFYNPGITDELPDLTPSRRRTQADVPLDELDLSQSPRQPERPESDEYFMGIAIAARERANCRGMRVGAVLVMDGRVVSTGYNGTPMGMDNCDEGGCERCANRESRFPSGTGYDVCICVHAEQNAMLNAARFGIHVEGGVIYTTTRPCFGCTKELLQAKVRAVYYLHEWRHPDESLLPEYEKLQARIPEGIKRLDMRDPRAAWAMPPKPIISEETGHQAP